MRQHSQEADGRTDSSSQSCSICPHIADKYKEIVSENIEDSPSQNCTCGQSRVLVISQISCQHLVKQEKGNGKFNRLHVLPCQGQSIILRSKENQKLFIKKDDQQPDDCGQYNRADYRSGKILIGLPDIAVCLSSDSAEKNRAPDSHQKSQAVDDIPHRCNYRQSCGAFRPVVLSHHSHINYGIDGRDQCASKGCRQVLKIQGFNLAV